MKLNFRTLPTQEDLSQNDVKPGFNDLFIKDVTKFITSTGSTALIFEHLVQNKLTIKSYVTYMSKDGDPINIGLYTIRKIMESCGVVPEGDFSIDIIPALLKGKSYRAELIEDEPYNGKVYLKVGRADTFGPVTSNTQETMTQEPTIQEDLAKELQATAAALVEDDDI